MSLLVLQNRILAKSENLKGNETGEELLKGHVVQLVLCVCWFEFFDRDGGHTTKLAVKYFSSFATCTWWEMLSHQCVWSVSLTL